MQPLCHLCACSGLKKKTHLQWLLRNSRSGEDVKLTAAAHRCSQVSYFHLVTDYRPQVEETVTAFLVELQPVATGHSEFRARERILSLVEPLLYLAPLSLSSCLPASPAVSSRPSSSSSSSSALLFLLFFFKQGQYRRD